MSLFEVCAFAKGVGEEGDAGDTGPAHVCPIIRPAAGGIAMPEVAIPAGAPLEKL